MADYDVVVCGGGCAGFCAAVASSRMGLKTALIEKYNMPGGILTVLGNASVDQFNNPFIPGNKMVIQGIGWEFVMRLYKEGYAEIPDMDAQYQVHWQYGVKVNSVAAAKIMDDMLLESGTDLFYGQPVVDVEVSDREIKGVIISTKAGLRKITAAIFIDCTGDGDIASFAGAEVAEGDGNGTFQPGTLRYYPAVAADDKILDYGDNENHISMDVTDSDSITKAEIAGRKMIFDQMKQGERIMAIAPAVAPREGRRIAGLTLMKVQDYCAGKIFEDSVCYSYWFVDIHRDTEAAIIRYIKTDKTPTIRLSSMISKDFGNLMMAGRCISTDRETNSAIRVKASCMAMGQAAGTAAAVALCTGKPVAEVCLELVKRKLVENGAIVPGINGTRSF